MLAYVVDGAVEVAKVLERDNRHAMPLQFFLAVTAIVLKAVCVGCATNDVLARLPQFLGFLTLAQDVVEHDDIRPVNMTFPVLHFLDEAIGNRPLRLCLDKITDFVAFLPDHPGDVANQSADGNEQKILCNNGHVQFTLSFE